MFTKRFCKRPWGWWLVLLDRKHFKLKLLRFNKGRACSMQYHNYRRELWLFLTGAGHWFDDEQVETLCAGFPQSYKHVDVWEKHQFRATMPTLVLEIQYGDKCVEEDIVRV